MDIYGYIWIYMDIYIYGYMDRWIYGYVDIWIYGILIYVYIYILGMYILCRIGTIVL